MKKIAILKTASALMLGLALTACATRSSKIEPSYVSPVKYKQYSCKQLREEARRVSDEAATAVGKQDKRATNDAVATGVALVLFWPAAFFVKGDGATEAEVARLKGEMKSIQASSDQKNCGITFQQG